MASATRRSVSTVIVLALMLALAVPSASAAPPAARRSPKRVSSRSLRARSSALRSLSVRPSAFLGPAVATWPADGYDEHGEDDTVTGARDLTSYISGLGAPNGIGMPAYEEAHTFKTASNESTLGAGDSACDEDWFYFDVSGDDWNACTPFTIEAHAGNAWVDPVIEVYGPTSAATITPTPPQQCLDATLTVPDPVAIASSDDDFWYCAGFSASVTFVPDSPGRYFFRVRPGFDNSGQFADPPFPIGFFDTWKGAGAGPYTLRVKAGQVTRLAGDNRILTAIQLSRERYADGELPYFDQSGAGTVVVATGYDFPDALAASTLAGAVGGPLLLTYSNKLDPAVENEIKRLDAHRVFMLGGTKTLTDDVKKALERVVGAGNVIRIQGKTRVQTAAGVARQADAEYGTAPFAFVTNGYKFPDALAASPMAAYNVAPILLTHKDSLDGDTLNAIRELGITDVVILGGTASVSSGVESALKRELGSDHVKRIGGADRYDTARQFVQWATGDYGATDLVGCAGTVEDNSLLPLDWRRFCVAAGSTYPDALGGGAFAGFAGYPLLLTGKGEISNRILDIGGALPPGGSFLSLEPGPGYVYDVERSFILGGNASVSDNAWSTLDALTGMP